MIANPFLGVTYHSIGAFSAASCYTPQKKTRLWAWEVYWIAQATFAWCILPVIGAILTIPNYFSVLAQCPRDAMLRSFLLGMLYGTGGFTFGLGIRYIGFSLNYSLAIGISAALGTILPLVWDPNLGFVGKISTLVDSTPGLIIFAGILLSFVGILFCGWAGTLRERTGGSNTMYNLKLGVAFACLAGILSAVYNFALIAGEPLATAAVHAGASNLLKYNAVYPFSSGGAWVTNVIWCVILLAKNKTAGQLVRLPDKGPAGLPLHYLMALLTGAMWYFQFFFYGMGHTNMGEKYGFTSWAVHMALLILFSNLIGKLFKEWHGASTLPRKIVHVGMALIIIATSIIAYGNYRGQSEKTTPPQANTTTTSVQK